MKPKLKRTSILGYGPTLFQYVFEMGLFYIGARYQNKNRYWKYQIGVGSEKYWFFPPLMLNFKKRPTVTNLYVLTVFLFVIYIPYFFGFQILVILKCFDIVLFKWLRQPSKEVSYITTMFWFLLALIFIIISFTT